MDGKYTIKITKGDTYLFKRELKKDIKEHRVDSLLRQYLLDDRDYIYKIYDKEDKKVGYVCTDKFEKLFFQPFPKKRYDIVIKRIWERF